MGTPELADFFSILRSGNEQAVEAMLRKLDPFLRRAIKLRLIGGRLRHAVDTMDILQSLLKDFLRQQMAGPPPAGGSCGLSAYLTAAVHHKVHRKARNERRHGGGLPDYREPFISGGDGTRQIDDEDLKQAIRARLSESNRLLFDLRSEGLAWAEIAAKVGGTPDALRIRLRRTITAVLAAMGHEEPSDAN